MSAQYYIEHPKPNNITVAGMNDWSYFSLYYSKKRYIGKLSSGTQVFTQQDHYYHPKYVNNPEIHTTQKCQAVVKSANCKMHQKKSHRKI
jgi:hypothetical protein